MRILRHTARRLLFLLPVLFGVTLIAFVLVRVLPGNPIDRMSSEYVPPARLEQLKREAGLKDPVYVQFGRYISHLVHGDAGTSFVTGLPVASELIRAFPATFELTSYSMVLTVLIGIPLGIISAVKQNSLADHLTRAMVVGGFSMPIFWLGLVLIYVFFFKLNIVPAPLGRIPAFVQPPAHITGLYTVDALLTRNWTSLLASFHVLILPVVTLAVSALAPVARMVRAEMVATLDSDFVRTAGALGLPRGRVLQDALRVVLLPIVTIIASVYGNLLSGSVLVESIFSYPGMGLYAFNAITNNDYTAVQAYIILAAFMYASIYLVLDLVYCYLDPRVQI